MQEKSGKTIPNHIAFIVDGNRRWAQKRGLSLVAGHTKVTNETIEALIFHAIKLGIPYLTFWAFSTENWKRGQRFTNMLFSILEQKMSKGVEKYNKAGIRLKIIGDLSKIPSPLRRKLVEWEQESAKNRQITVVIALNYGGRDELVRAINKLIAQLTTPGVGLRSRRTPPASTLGVKLTKKDFTQYLDTVGIPDPDLIIRTGGVKRLSGFMSWQSAYSELYFTDTLFPDMTPAKMDEAIKDYQQRKRNFGK